MKKKHRAGRPLKEDKPQKRRNVSLSDTCADKARQIGSGNVSEGLRVAVESYQIEEKGSE